jgi:hypothetical protein
MRSEQEDEMALYVQVVDKQGKMLYFHVSDFKDERALMRQEVKWSMPGRIVAEALSEIDETREELEDIAIAAFELGRRWERKYGAGSKSKKKLEQEIAKLRQQAYPSDAAKRAERPFNV